MSPSLKQAEELHRKYATTPEAFEKVFSHCQIVWEIAKQLIDKSHLNVDKDFIQVACLLHDIGVYEIIKQNLYQDDKQYIRHGVLGYELLKKEGLDERLCEICRRHTGTGITKEDIKSRGLPLPEMDYIARTLEERIIMYADKFHSKRPKFNSYESYLEYVKQYGEDKVVEFEKLAKEFGK